MAAENMSTECMYSSVRNTSGESKIFGFLPPHGRRLAANEEFVVFGDIREAIISFERTNGRRSIIAFEQALQRGDLEIQHTPNVILKDQSTGDVRQLRLFSGTLGVVSPCWEGSYSEPVLG